MKTKQNSLIIVFIFLVIVFKITLAETVYISPSSLTIIQYIEDGITGYTTGGNYQIGRLDESGVQIRYRTRYEFYLASVPYDARIDSVKISYNINNGGSSSNKARFVKLPDEYYGESDQWGRFTSSGTVYASNLSYNQDYPDKKYSQLTADVTTAIQGDHFFCIGFMSENESTNGTYANVYISFITVYYSPKVIVTIQNSFGGGKVEIDGQLQDSPYASSTWYAGDSHNIRAYTQIINAITYPFPTPGTWKNITTGEEKSQINNNTPISISPGDNCIWQANFNPATANIIVDQKLSSGASTGSIGLWTGANFTEYSVPKSFSFPFSSNQILRGEQQITSQEKYNYWEKGQDQDNDVKNHHVFQIDQSIPGYLTARFKPTFGGISIQTNFFEVSGIYNSNIQFKDPWFIDYADPNCGNNYRNQGNDAVFRTRTTPFVIDYSTTYENNQSYKGVFLNQNPNFYPNIPTYSLKVPQPQTVNFGGAIGLRPVYFVNWNYDANKATLKYPNASETPVVFKTSDAAITANLKASLISSSSSAFSNNSQRKFVRTQDGWLHMVYESEGHIWLEHSSDGGNTWILGNNGKPLDNGGGKSPSISYNLPIPSYYSIVLVAFQEGSDIRVRSFAWDGISSYINGPQDWIPSGESPSASLSPNIAFGNDGVFMVVWKKSSGIAYILGILIHLCIGHAGNSQGIISGTNGNSYNPTISTNLLEPGYFDVAWQQQGTPVNGPPPVSIKACRLFFDGEYNCQNGYWGSVSQYNPPQSTISSSSMKINSNPSIISCPDGPIVSWIADYSGYFTPSQTKAVLHKAWETPFYHVYDAYCKSTSISKKDDGSGYYLAYSYMPDIQGWCKYDLAVSSGNLSVTKVVSTNGPYLQLCNGPNKENIYVMAYYPYTIPYYFKKSNSLASAGLSKSVDFLTSDSRGVIIENNESGLYYSFGQITVNGNPVNFIPINNDANRVGLNQRTRMERIKNGTNVNLISTDTLNSYLISEPFEMNGNSEIIFGDKFEIGDSTTIKIILGEKGYISFKVDLTDDINGKIIGTIKESKCFRNTLPPRKSSFYKLANSKLGEKRVRIKITVDTNIKEPIFSIVDEHTNADLREGIKKSSIKELSLSNLVTIDEYALHQAYPNPFNPVTTIHYELPKAGHVTLRVYNLLGEEVATLVKGEKQAGRYSVTFDGSRLASGEYIVRMQSGNYSKTIKILLMK